MKFTRETGGTISVSGVSADKGFRIGDRWLAGPLALTRSGSLDEAPDKSLDALVVDDLEALLTGSVDILLLGTGKDFTPIPPALSFALARRGVGLEVMSSAAAARTFNVLVGEDRRVAALLYPLSGSRAEAS